MRNLISDNRYLLAAIVGAFICLMMIVRTALELLEKVCRHGG